MSSEDKPEQRPTPPPPGETKREASSPSLDELDSAWEGDEDLDEDATTVARIPKELVALSRRGSELEKKEEPTEKHEAITARPPPGGEASVVVDAPHQQLPKIETKPPAVAAAPVDEDDDEDEDGEPEEAAEPELDDLDAGWDVEEEKAAAADVAAGLDADARRRAAEARATQRKEKSRARKIAAKEKRKAKTDSIRLKQKKPRKRSIPPPRDLSSAGSGAMTKSGGDAGPTSRERPTIPPKTSRPPETLAAHRDMLRMVLLVALVVVVGALVIGLARR